MFDPRLHFPMWAVIADMQEAVALMIALTAGLYLAKVWLLPLGQLLDRDSNNLEGSQPGQGGCGSGGCGHCARHPRTSATAASEPQPIVLGPPTRLNRPFSAKGAGQSSGS